MGGTNTTMSEILQIPSTTKSGVFYKLTINPETNNVKCSCTGFQCHGYCKHTQIYKTRINKLLFGDPFIEKVISSFNNCYEFVRQLCTEYPETIGDYDKLDYYSQNILEGIDKHYGTETIHRAYRKLVEDGEILEPTKHQIRKEKTEQIMHHINKWSPKTFIHHGPQAQLIPNELGVEK